MNGLAAPSVVARLGHLLVSPALSLQRLHLSPGLGAGCPLLHTQHEVPSCSLLSPCVGVAKSDLHTVATRTGKYNQEPILGSFPGSRVLLVGYLSLSLGSQLHPSPLCAERGKASLSQDRSLVRAGSGVLLSS